MAEPTKKSPEIEALIDSTTPGPITRVNSIKSDICSWCGAEATQFKDDLSRQEYRISGLCQQCQDETFGV